MYKIKILVLISLVLLIGCYKKNPTSPKQNHPPVIISLSASVTNIDCGETTKLAVVASDPDNDKLSVYWSASSGIFLSTSHDSAIWQAPDSSGNFKCTAKVSDGKATVDSSVIITVTSGSKFVGNWSGKTSQNYPISFKIENTGEYIGVTQMKYKIYLQGQGWGVTTEGIVTFNTPIKIINEKFNYTGYSLQVDGMFTNSNKLTGNLKASHTHPQGLGTASGSVTYSANKL